MCFVIYIYKVNVVVASTFPAVSNAEWQAVTGFNSPLIEILFTILLLFLTGETVERATRVLPVFDFRAAEFSKSRLFCDRIVSEKPPKHHVSPLWPVDVAELGAGEIF